ncbi:glycosyltransferase family 2 protein [Desulfobacterales bacterium HSG2]|nr:glycosyltransferase family 2 protein [Desulfobacterales bacterium HSG2]
MKTVPISVIIPCYNCADTIERAVNSVVSQTCRPAELVLTDDASNDSTLSKILELKERLGKEWIKVIALKHNSGPAAARNAAWDAADEKYLAFLDADDSWHPRKIEIQYSWMKRHPEVVLTGHRCIQADNKAPDPRLPAMNWRFFQVRPVRLLISNKMLTRSVMLLRNLPYRFNINKRHAEDYLLWLEIVLNGYAAWYLDLPLGYSYKSPFGEGGLTGDLWKMEKGELDTFRRLYRKGLLSAFSTCCMTFFSLMKYMRRLLITYMKTSDNRQSIK